MGLKSILLCSDEKIVRVMRRVLGDLEIEVELCSDAEAALRKLTRHRFEAIIADLSEDGATDVLRSARNAPCNRQAVAVAIVEPVIGLKAVFQVGAHFVLYKPVSSEKAKSGLRAARALMKSERRRNARVAVQIGVIVRSSEAGGNMKVTTVDLSEGGMAIALPTRRCPSGPLQLAFALPGTEKQLEVAAEFAWEGSKSQGGLRFVNPSTEVILQLREWLKQNSTDAEQDDPPIRCQLTDLSLRGCYLEISSPFPALSRVTLSMRAREVEVRVQGIVRVMHPDKGMGVEFTQKTGEDRADLERFLHVLTENQGLKPELLVQPDGLDSEATPKPTKDQIDDPLLQLFYGEPLSVEAFQQALQQQRGMSVPEAMPSAVSTPA